MIAAMIPVAPDVLARLVTLRRSEGESLDEVLRRLLPPATRPAVVLAKRPVAAVPNARSGSFAYLLHGERRVARDATEAMTNILRDLAQYDDTFWEKLAPKARGRTRNHIARTRLHVYPGRPDLARYVKEISPGWFIGCNISNRDKERILRAACDVMGLVYERDIKLDLGRG